MPFQSFLGRFRIPFLPMGKRIVEWPAGRPEDPTLDLDLLQILADQVLFAEKGPRIIRQAPVFASGDLAPKMTQTESIQLPNIYLALLMGGRVLGRTVAAINRAGTIFGDISIDWRHPRRNHKYRGWKLVRSPIHLKGRTLCLAATGAETFSHLLFDSLGRLWLAEEAGLEPDFFDFLIVQNNSETLRAFLNFLGWGKSQVLDLSQERHFLCDQLYVASYQSGIGHYHPRFIDWLRRRVLSFFRDIDSPSPRWIFISRAGAGSRRLLNEMELFYLARNYQDFQLALLETMPLGKQIQYFLNAKGVVAPHGAGLTHLCWTPSKTPTLEFFPDNFFNAYYWDLASTLNNPYACVQGIGNLNRNPEVSNYRINPSHAANALKKLWG
ncbi:MAG: DUF563 domain-containing protein [Verrucomicrobia bacterium]|nr:DUF563 domain-containing protein [Verrucomicrobiota bacterium]